MRAIVCLAQVPEDGGRLRLAPEGGGFAPDGISWSLSTFDRYALEAALTLRDARGGDVVALHVGPDHPPSALTEALALGADSAVGVWDAALDESRLDTLGLSRILHAAIERLRPFDLVLAGHQAVGLDHAQVPVLLAERLDLPVVTSVVSFEWQEEELRVHRESDGGREEWICPRPAVIAAHKGLSDPRHRSLKGLLAAKKKPLERLTLTDLGLEQGQVSPTLQVAAVAPSPPRPPTRWIEGSVDDQARAAVAWLQQVLS